MGIEYYPRHIAYLEGLGESVPSTYDGCVINTSTREIRVMSDVWDDELQVVVWDEVAQRFDHISLGPTMYRTGNATVDASSDLQARYAELRKRVADEAQKRNAALARERHIADARADMLMVREGCIAEVFKGKKVKPGTRGTVTKVGSNQYGGYAIIETTHPEEGRAFVGLGHVRPLFDGFDPYDRGESPSVGWVEFRRLWLDARSALLSQRGDTVRVIATGAVGVVFYQKGDRLGVDTRPMTRRVGRAPSPVWVNMDQVEKVTS